MDVRLPADFFFGTETAEAHLTSGVIRRPPQHMGGISISPDGRVALTFNNQLHRLYTIDLLYGCKATYSYVHGIADIFALSAESALAEVVVEGRSFVRLFFLDGASGEVVVRDSLPLTGDYPAYEISNNGKYLWLCLHGKWHCYLVGNEFKFLKVFERIGEISLTFRVDGDAVYHYSRTFNKMRGALWRTSWDEWDRQLLCEENYRWPQHTDKRNGQIWIGDHFLCYGEDNIGYLEIILYNKLGKNFSRFHQIHSPTDHWWCSFYPVNNGQLTVVEHGVGDTLLTFKHWSVRRPEPLLNLTTRMVAKNRHCRIPGYRPLPVPICDDQRCHHFHTNQDRYEIVRLSANENPKASIRRRRSVGDLRAPRSETRSKSSPPKYEFEIDFYEEWRTQLR